MLLRAPENRHTVHVTYEVTPGGLEFFAMQAPHSLVNVGQEMGSCAGGASLPPSGQALGARTPENDYRSIVSGGSLLLLPRGPIDVRYSCRGRLRATRGPLSILPECPGQLLAGKHYFWHRQSHRPTNPGTARLYQEVLHVTKQDATTPCIPNVHHQTRVFAHAQAGAGPGGSVGHVRRAPQTSSPSPTSRVTADQPLLWRSWGSPKRRRFNRRDCLTRSGRLGHTGEWFFSQTLASRQRFGCSHSATYCVHTQTIPPSHRSERPQGPAQHRIANRSVSHRGCLLAGQSPARRGTAQPNTHVASAFLEFSLSAGRSPFLSCGSVMVAWRLVQPPVLVRVQAARVSQTGTGSRRQAASSQVETNGGGDCRPL